MNKVVVGATMRLRPEAWRGRRDKGAHQRRESRRVIARVSDPREGFSLAELSIALGIAAFALIAIFGLLPVGVGSNNASIRQTEAVNLATGIIEDLRQAPPGAGAVSPRYQIELDQVPAEFFIDQSGQSVPQNAADYRVEVKLSAPAPGRRTATCGSVILAWPPGAATPLHAISTFVALDRN